MELSEALSGILFSVGPPWLSKRDPKRSSSGAVAHGRASKADQAVHRNMRLLDQRASDLERALEIERSITPLHKD